MEYTKISLEELRRIDKKWAKSIYKIFQPDLIIYVAKAGFLIGHDLSIELGIPLIGIKTVREKGNKLKEIVAPMVRIMPDFIRNILISIELNSGVHEKNDKRIVHFIDNMSNDECESICKILIVDDSVDTGASILSVCNCVKRTYKNAIIKTAGLNVWDKSEKLIKIDFCFFKNTVIKAPMSKDSKEYSKFIAEYNKFLTNREEKCRY